MKCDKCGLVIKFDYSANNECWNKIVGKPDGQLCIDCFITLAEIKSIVPKFIRFFGNEFFYEVGQEAHDDKDTQT